MKENHIEKMEWTQYFASQQHTAEHMKLQSRILMHIEHCASCRDLYEKGLALQNAARAYANSAAPFAADDGAYQAVASTGSPQKTKKRSGSLAVDIDADMGCFLDYTLEAQGCANKYALNPESEGKRLVDDGGEMTLALEDGKVQVIFRDEKMQVTGHLLTPEGETALVFAQGHARAALPPEDFCALELFFTE